MINLTWKNVSYKRKQKEMIEQQLIKRGIRNQLVLEAFQKLKDIIL